MENNNPYVLSSLDITKRQQYIGRSEAFDLLYQKIRRGENIAIQGPEGTGKTQFLNCALNKSKRRELAKSGILVARMVFGISDDADTFFCAIADSLRIAIELLQDIQDEDAEASYHSLLASAEQLRKTSSNGHGYLGGMCSALTDEGFTGYVVIDGFEQFVNSRHITKEHHEVLRSFMANTKMRLIVATDYDFNKSTLPAGAAGSLLLQKFSGNEIPLAGLSLEECAGFLNLIGNDNDFTDAERRKLYSYSGGVPKLLCAAANVAWAQKRDNGMISWKQVRQDAALALKDLFVRWAMHLDQREADLLKDRAKEGDLEAIQRSETVAQLIKRGLITDSADIQFRDLYLINSVLFRDYCHEHELPVYSGDTLPMPSPGASPVTVHVHPGGKLYMAGAVYPSQTVIFNGESIQELVHWIAKPEQAKLPTDGFQQLLGSALSKHFMACIPESLPERANTSAEDYEQICDEHYSAVGEKLLPSIPVNEDNEAVIEVDAEELLTVDDRFEAVRNRRADLTDDILNGQSERCRLYLKLSVIVEDALSVVGAFMDDYSPQLVLYGKALEQSLRDNLFLFFSNESTLRTFDTYSGKDDPGSDKVFIKLDCGKSFIGSYFHMMKCKKQYLSDFCVRHGLVYNGNQPNYRWWYTWWGDLSSATADVKSIRDKADHASSNPPTKADLDAMCRGLFGNQASPGVLSRLTVGLDLWYHLNASINAEAVHALEQSTCEVKIDRIKLGNALDCSTLDGRFMVKISKSESNKYLSRHDECTLLEGMHLRALLSVYEQLPDRDGFFHASIDSVIMN